MGKCKKKEAYTFKKGKASTAVSCQGVTVFIIVRFRGFWIILRFRDLFLKDQSCQL